MADLEPSTRWSTIQWQPPELPVTSLKADVWCVGAVLHALAHEGNPPIGPLPDGAFNDEYAWDAWCEKPISRDPIPFYGVYSEHLHDCVFKTLEFDPIKRCNSIQMYSKVVDTWAVHAAPYCEMIAPLLSTDALRTNKRNRMSINTEEVYVTAPEQMSPSTNAVEVSAPVDPANHKSPELVGTPYKKLKHFEKPYACRNNWIVESSMQSTSMEDVQFTDRSSNPVANVLADNGDDSSAFETAIDVVQLRAVASAMNDENAMSWNDERATFPTTNRDLGRHSHHNGLALPLTNSLQARQLLSALSDSVGGADFRVDVTSWSIGLGNEMFLFGDIAKNLSENDRTDRLAGFGIRTDAQDEVDPTGWYVERMT